MNRIHAYSTKLIIIHSFIALTPILILDIIVISLHNFSKDLIS